MAAKWDGKVAKDVEVRVTPTYKLHTRAKYTKCQAQTVHRLEIPEDVKRVIAYPNSSGAPRFVGRGAKRVKLADSLVVR